MKLPEFEYQVPATVAEAIGLLAQHQDEASLLAGGLLLRPLKLKLLVILCVTKFL